MRQAIHHHYDQLTVKERRFVDDAMNEVFSVAKQRFVPLAGDDRAERAADALARAVIESRKENPA
jgi:hypothetical protein